jgi:arylsulfatase A-like enzyme
LLIQHCLRWAAGCLLALIVCSLLPGDQTARPNVVFIYIDDLGWADVGFLGSESWRTPAIDELAASGMVFTDAYAAAPNCAPSRASLLSGQYPPRHGVYTVGNPARGSARRRRLIPVKNRITLSTDVVTLGELFQSAGYRTGWVGKWHLGQPGQAGPREQGFDVNVGGNHTGSPRGGYFSPWQNPQLPDPASPEYLTDRLTEESTGFIRRHHDQPFFLFLSHYAVHTPIQARPELVREFSAAAAAEGWRADYAAMIASVDQSVAALMQCLEELQLRDKTFVVFYSDNGGQAKITSCAPLRGGKGMPWEGGIRVPLAVSWPGRIAAGSRCRVPVHGVDFFQTFRVMLDAETPEQQTLDGIDLMPLLSGTADSPNRDLFWHFPAYLQGRDYPGAADSWFRARPFGIIRSENWKLIESFEDGQLQLYDLSRDLGETTDVAGEHPELTQRLADRLRQWRSDIGAPVPDRRNPEFQPDQD